MKMFKINLISFIRVSMLFLMPRTSRINSSSRSTPKRSSSKTSKRRKKSVNFSVEFSNRIEMSAVMKLKRWQMSRVGWNVRRPVTLFEQKKTNSVLRVDLNRFRMTSMREIRSCKSRSRSVRE